MTKGKQRLFPISYEVCMLQTQAITLLNIIDEQEAAIDRLYNRVTVRGVYRGLLAHKQSFPQRLFNRLSLKINHQVDWLLVPPKRFDDVSPSEPACVVSEEGDQGQQQQQQQEQQECPEAPDATCIVASTPPGCSSKKDKRKTNLGRACKGLLGGFASGFARLSRQAAKTAGRLLCITKPAA